MTTSFATVYLIYVKFRATYDHNHDTFRIEFLAIPAFILSLLINHDFTVFEVRNFYVFTKYDVNCVFVGVVDFQYLFRVSGNFATAVHG